MIRKITIKICNDQISELKENQMVYLVQLIEQPILRIPIFNFPNLRCCKVFLFFVCKEICWYFLMYFGLNLKLLSCQYQSTLTCLIVLLLNKRAHPKGQLISKGNFCVLYSSKNELENDNFLPYLAYWGRNFRSFFGIIGKDKKPF